MLKNMPINVMVPTKISNSIDITSLPTKNHSPVPANGLRLMIVICFVSVYLVIHSAYESVIRETVVAVIMHGNNQMFMHLNAHDFGSLNNYRCDFYVLRGRFQTITWMVMTKNHGRRVGQYGGLQHFSRMNRSTGQVPGGHNVQTDNLIFGIEKDHTELFTIRLALRFNQLLYQWL